MSESALNPEGDRAPKIRFAPNADLKPTSNIASNLGQKSAADAGLTADIRAGLALDRKPELQGRKDGLQVSQTRAANDPRATRATRAISAARTDASMKALASTSTAPIPLPTFTRHRFHLAAGAIGLICAPIVTLSWAKASMSLNAAVLAGHTFGTWETVLWASVTAALLLICAIISGRLSSWALVSFSAISTILSILLITIPLPDAIAQLLTLPATKPDGGTALIAEPLGSAAVILALPALAVGTTVATFFARIDGVQGQVLDRQDLEAAKTAGVVSPPPPRSRQLRQTQALMTSLIFAVVAGLMLIEQANHYLRKLDGGIIPKTKTRHFMEVIVNLNDGGTVSGLVIQGVIVLACFGLSVAGVRSSLGPMSIGAIFMVLPTGVIGVSALLVGDVMTSSSALIQAIALANPAYGLIGMAVFALAWAPRFARSEGYRREKREYAAANISK